MPTYIISGRAYIGANNITIELERGIDSINLREGHTNTNIVNIFF